MPVLTIDAREKTKWHTAFKDFVPVKFPDWDVDIRLIEVGDYAHSDLVGIEHKSPSDFLSSLQSGKLFDQAYELANAYRQAFIVVDGVPRQLWSDEYVRHTADNIFGVLSSLAVRRRTPVLFTGSNEVHFMTQILKICAKTQGDGSFVYNPVRRNGSKREMGQHLIASLPGVGPKRAATILAFYKNPLEALANYKQWSTLDGIGTGTTSKVEEVLEAERQTAHGEVQAEKPVRDVRADRAREEIAGIRAKIPHRRLLHASPDVLRSTGDREDKRGARAGS